MVQTIALLALLIIAIGITLGNYWFTYGLWPQSWTSFVLFAIAGLIVSSAIQHVMKSDD